MEVDDDNGMGVHLGQEDDDAILSPKDVELLERLKTTYVEEPSGPPPDCLEDWWYNRDSDDDDPGPSYDPKDVDNGF